MTTIHKLTNEEMDQLPLAQFDDTIQLIDTPERLAAAIAEMRSCAMLGFDTETRPSFRRGVSYKVALLQLSSEHTSWLIRINKLGLPDSLAAVLSDPSIMKVGLAIRDDIKGLQKWRDFEPQNFIDLQTVAKEMDFEDFSLKKLAAHVMGVRISKRQRLSNWEAPMLTVPQQRYAATDSWVSLMIYLGLRSGVREHARVQEIIKRSENK